MTVRADLAAARNVPWATTLEIEYRGAELPAIGSIAMHVRLYPGADGEPLLALADIVHEDVAEPTEAEPDLRVLRLFLEAAEEDLAAMPTGLNAPEPGEADSFAYDIVITFADEAEDRIAFGNFLLEPGVTV